MGLMVDALIVVLYFALIVVIGLRAGRKEGSLHDFALGGRRVPWWAVMASLIAAEVSAATYLGAPVEGYNRLSLAYVQLVVGLIIGRTLVGTFFLAPYYRYRVYTVYDYLDVRFGPRTKTAVSGLFLLMRTLASGTRLFVPSLVIVLAWRLFTQGHGSVKVAPNAVTSLGEYGVAIVAITAITCLYATLGGIKAVIWTDVIQATLMFGSALVAVGTLLYHVGGLGAVLEAAPKLTHLEGYFVTGLEPDAVLAWYKSNHATGVGWWDTLRLILGSDYTVFSATIGATFANMAAFGTDQDMTQRLLTAETHQKARRSLLAATFLDIPIAVTFTFIGVLLFAYYQKFPTFKPAAPADVFGAYILNVLPTGIRGLVLAGLFATAMGSLSAALNALATSATNDWYLPRHPHREPGHYVAVARGFTLLFSVLMCAVALAFAWAKIRNTDIAIIPVVLGIAFFILGPMLGVFLLGICTRTRGSDRGNLLAVAIGLVVTIVLGNLHITLLNGILALLGSSREFVRPDWLPTVAFTWFAAIGAFVVFAVGALFKTPTAALERAERQEQAAQHSDEPLALRAGTR